MRWDFKSGTHHSVLTGCSTNVAKRYTSDCPPTPAHSHLLTYTCSPTPAHPHTCSPTPAHPHTCSPTPAHPHLLTYTCSPTHLLTYTCSPTHLLTGHLSCAIEFPKKPSDCDLLSNNQDTLCTQDLPPVKTSCCGKSWSKIVACLCL